jgi:type VI secretion system protein ImpK
MMEQMYWACADALSLGAQLGRARDLPTADVLQRRVASVLEQAADKARAARIPEEDITEARYAMVAFIDEKILTSEWPGKQTWQARPLQLMYFNENTAGEGFFARLHELENTPRRAHVLQIYYLCLALGFRGQYAVRGEQGLSAIVDSVGNKISRLLPASEIISPKGEPEGRVRSIVRREAPIVGVSLGILALSLLLFIVLRVTLGVSTSSAVEDMRNFAASPPGK